MRRRHGLNMVEFLLIIAVIGLIIAIVLPSLGRARWGSHRPCAVSLKMQGLAFAIYCANHKRRVGPRRARALDRCASRRSRPRDAFTGSMAGSAGVPQKAFYCATTRSRIRPNCGIAAV